MKRLRSIGLLLILLIVVAGFGSQFERETLVCRFDASPTWALAVQFAPNSEELAVACNDGSVSWINLKGSVAKRCTTEVTQPFDLVFDRSGEWLAVLGFDSWEFVPTAAGKSWHLEGSSPMAAAPGKPDSDERFVVLSLNGNIRYLDPSRQTARHVKHIGRQGITSAISSDARVVSLDGREMQLWNFTSRLPKPRFRFPRRGRRVPWVRPAPSWPPR